MKFDWVIQYMQIIIGGLIQMQIKSTLLSRTIDDLVSIVVYKDRRF